MKLIFYKTASDLSAFATFSWRIEKDLYFTTLGNIVFHKTAKFRKGFTLTNTKRMMESHGYDLGHTLREKCPNADLFLVRIFLYSKWIRKISVFSPNTGKYGPEITPYLDTFHAVMVSWFIRMFKESRICYAVFKEKRS